MVLLGSGENDYHTKKARAGKPAFKTRETKLYKTRAQTAPPAQNNFANGTSLFLVQVFLYFSLLLCNVNVKTDNT